MADHAKTGDSLYLAWRINSNNPLAAGNARELLTQGEGNRLFRLRSWVIVNDEAQALVAPQVSLDRIADAIWNDSDKPVKSRWIHSPRACAKLSREIETRPVELGLACRPEQWPFSSAAGD